MISLLSSFVPTRRFSYRGGIRHEHPFYSYSKLLILLYTDLLTHFWMSHVEFFFNFVHGFITFLDSLLQCKI